MDTTNHVALHTTSGCVVQSNGQTSTFDTTNCDVNAAGQSANAGCGGYSAETTSYGDGFNDVGGGVYAMDWRAEGIRIWTFPRSSIPQDILDGNPTTAGWPLVHSFLYFTNDSLILISRDREQIYPLISTLIKSFLI
jgi:hypothetical protein